MTRHGIVRRIIAAVVVGVLAVAAPAFTTAASAQADSVTLVIANGRSLSDVGTAASLVAAGQGDAVLFVATDSLTPPAISVVSDYPPSHVLLVGGTAALTADVESELAELAPGVTIERFAGTDRIDTAARAARESLGDATGGTLVIANGWSLSDVGTAASVVASGGADAVLYSGKNDLGEATKAVIAERQPSQVLLVGGEAVLTADIEAQIAEAASDAAVDRYGGATRIETAASSAERAFDEGASVAVIANGWTLDHVGVAAAYAAARDDAAVLYAQRTKLTDATEDLLEEHEPTLIVLIGGRDDLSSRIDAELDTAVPDATVLRVSDATRLDIAATAARLALRGDLDLTPGEGNDVTMGRANWSTGYFQAELYRQLLSELGYEVSDPARRETGGPAGHKAIAEGEIDFWVNTWTPQHLWHFDQQLDDGSTVNDHVSVIGEQMIHGGLQGFLITKSFADRYDVYTLDQLNDDATALAAFDAADPRPGNGKADIYGCPTSWVCDDVINSQIALGGWENIEQVTDDYEDMFSAARDGITARRPVIFYTWTPSQYIASFEPGDDVYWLGMDQILDDSNPASLPGGAGLDQTGPDGTDGYAAIGTDECPSAKSTANRLCPTGWIAADIQVTANDDFLTENPAAAALLASVRLSPLEVSAALAKQYSGTSLNELASGWIADHRDMVDAWLMQARLAS